MLDHFLRNRKVLVQLLNADVRNLKTTLSAAVIDFIVDSKDTNWTQLEKLNVFYRELSKVIIRSQSVDVTLSEAIHLIGCLEKSLITFLSDFSFDEEGLEQPAIK